MLALYPLWRKARRVYSLTSRLPGTNRLGFQPSLALSVGAIAPLPQGVFTSLMTCVFLASHPVHRIALHVSNLTRERHRIVEGWGPAPP
ncbi:MAG: hypothetical protein ABW170_18105 [Candidatus Thiodiazotropha sp. L084R]